MVPPRPKLTWKDIVEYSFLGEFDLLRHSRTDICNHDWTTPAHREATVKYFKLRRAHEEIQRLNVEVRRLRTAIHDEQVNTIATIDRLLETDRTLAVELKSRYQARAAVNAVHLFRLDQLKSQHAFSGKWDISVRLEARHCCHMVSQKQRVHHHTLVCRLHDFNALTDDL